MDSFSSFSYSFWCSNLIQIWPVRHTPPLSWLLCSLGWGGSDFLFSYYFKCRSYKNSKRNSCIPLRQTLQLFTCCPFASSSLSLSLSIYVYICSEPPESKWRHCSPLPLNISVCISQEQGHSLTSPPNCDTTLGDLSLIPHPELLYSHL